MDNRGRDKGSPKVGGAKKGAVQTATLEVKEAVLRIFSEVNANDEYLRDLAVDDKKLFLSLLARLIPVSQNIQVEKTLHIDLSAAMREADARLKTFNSHMQVLDQEADDLTDVEYDYSQEPVSIPAPNQWAGYEDGPKPGQQSRSKALAK